MKTLQTSRCKQIRQFKAEINSQPWVCSSTGRNSAEQKKTFNFRLWLFSAFFFPQILQGYSSVSKRKAELTVLLSHLPSLKSNMTWWHGWVFAMNVIMFYMNVIYSFPITTTKSNKAGKLNPLWKFPQKFPEAQNSSWVCLMLWKQKNKHTPHCLHINQ